MVQRLRGTFMTNSGMNCVWNPDAFTSVRDYETWEAQLLDDSDIVRHIEAGAFVPINISSDGSFEVEVRVGSAEQPSILSARETKYAVVASENYLFRSTGRLCVSGIEYVEHETGGSVGVLAIPEGDYAVTIHLIGWDQEPGMQGEDGTPAKEALPDFVVLLNPSADGAAKFRVKLETFQRPSSTQNDER